MESSMANNITAVSGLLVGVGALIVSAGVGYLVIKLGRALEKLG